MFLLSVVLERLWVVPKVDELLATQTSDGLRPRMIFHHVPDNVPWKISAVGAQLAGVLRHEVMVPQVASCRLLRILETKLTLPRRMRKVRRVCSLRPYFCDIFL